MDEAVLKQQAAETLRSVEGMRRRTIAVGGRASTFPLIAFGIASLIAAAFGILDRPECTYETLASGVVQGSCSGIRTIGAAPAAGIFVALLVAFVATEIHYRRQPVHPAQPKRQISTGQAILLAALLIVFGQFLLGALFLAVTLPFVSGGSTVFFLLYSIAAVVQGKRIRSGALAWAGAIAVVSLAIARFINTDFETAIVGLAFGAAFLSAAGLLHLRQNRAA